MAKLICFDLWETLVTESSTTEGIWGPLMEAYPDKAPWEKVHALIKQIMHKKDQSTIASTLEILEALEIDDDEVAAEVSRRWNTSCDGSTIFPDTIEALEEARKRGFQLALITNTSRYGWDVIENRFQLSKRFDYLALSFECKAVKPEPAIFEYIERASKLPGSEIVMIGDSYRSDYLPPRERGWRSVLLDRFQKNENPDAEPVIHTLRELNAILT
jgi:FMN phosphatase YigB (HAD superfamily)